VARAVLIGLVILGVVVGIATSSDSVDDRGTLFHVLGGAVVVMAVAWVVAARRRRVRD
jgi:heme A synthase